MHVQRRGLEALYLLRDAANLARGWVTNEDATLKVRQEHANQEEEEAVAGGLHGDESMVVNPGDGLELGLAGDGGLVVEGVEVAARCVLEFSEEDKGKGGLKRFLSEKCFVWAFTRRNGIL
jgi:hypothetical protein